MLQLLQSNQKQIRPGGIGSPLSSRKGGALERVGVRYSMLLHHPRNPLLHHPVELSRRG